MPYGRFASKSTCNKLYYHVSFMTNSWDNPFLLFRQTFAWLNRTITQQTIVELSVLAQGDICLIYYVKLNNICRGCGALCMSSENGAQVEACIDLAS